MTQTLPCLHPNPGWTEAPAATTAASPLPHQISETVGKHCILELYGCDSAKLDDEVFLRESLCGARRRAFSQRPQAHQLPPRDTAVDC